MYEINNIIIISLTFLADLYSNVSSTILDLGFNTLLFIVHSVPNHLVCTPTLTEFAEKTTKKFDVAVS